MAGIFGGGSAGGQGSQQSPLTRFNIQSSAYGLPIPLVYGKNRIAGNLIWFGDFQAIAHKNTQSGGKGGSVSSTSVTYTYKGSLMFGLCEGAITSINRVWKEKEAGKLPDAFTKFLGGDSQTAWTYLTTAHPSEAYNYRGHGYVAAANYDLLDNASIGNHSFEVSALLPFNAGVIDQCNPKDWLEDFSTNVKRGAGFLGSYMGDLSDFSNYCVANSFFISPVHASQAEAREIITEIMDLLNCGIFFSEGKLKVVPLTDQSAAGNGASFTANVTPVFNFTDDDFLDDEQPVIITRIAPSDVYNRVQVEYQDADNAYNKEIVTAQDQSSIELDGLKLRELITAHWITSATMALALAQTVLQKSTSIMNNYEFRVSMRYSQLEPCDYVTLTDPVAGLDNVPVRILSIEEDEDGNLTITAEDAPGGVSSTVPYGSQDSSGYVVDYNVSPGSVATPAFFEVPANKSLTGLAIGIAATGTVPAWGGCEVFVSSNGTNYGSMGMITQPADYGTTVNSVTAAVNQVLRVDLAGIGGQLLGGTTQDADNNVTSCLVNNEFVAYTTSALISTNRYDLTLAKRGLQSSTAAAHSSGEKFVRINEAIAYSDSLSLDMVGKTLYFKFLSFNIYGGAKQQLSDVSAYTYTITGDMAKLAPLNITSVTATQTTKGILLQWTNPSNDRNLKSIEIWRGTVNIAPGVGGSNAQLVNSVKYPTAAYSDIIIANGQQYYYWLRGINQYDFPSAFTSSVTATGANIGGIEIVNTLPSTGNYDGRVAYLTTDKTIYRHNGTSWLSTADGAYMKDGTILATKLLVAQLAAISADLGDINAGSLNINNLFIVDAAGNVIIQDGTFYGELAAATGTFGGQLLAGVIDFASAVGQTTYYNTPGTYTLTVPAAQTSMRVTLCGGSGGGGGGGNINAAGGGGGGSCGLVIATLTGLTPGATYSLTVGSAGAAGVSAAAGAAFLTAGSAGTAGTATVVTGVATANGGGGGGGAAGSTPGAGGSAGSNGNAGGNGTYTPRAKGLGGAIAVGNKGGDGGLQTGSPNPQAGKPGYAIVEFYEPNAVVLQAKYSALKDALHAQGISTGSG